MLACLRVVFLLTLCLLTARAQRNCNVPADLFFIIDGSDSLTDENFSASKQFVVDVLSYFNVRNGAVHVGANVFGTEVYDRIQLHGPTIYQLFIQRVLTLSRVRSGTATYRAIAEMRDEFTQRGRNVARVGIVITDGRSISIDNTAREAQLARADGISMIAIGMGDANAGNFNNIYRPELESIAGSNASVYLTLDIASIVQTIEEAIKNFVCIDTTTTSTTTQAPTTPEANGLNNFDCPDCMIDEGHGFKPHPSNCEKYLEIIADATGNLRSLVRKCTNGLFWDQYYTTCRRPEYVDCPHDPCRNLAVASYDIEGLCSGYVACIGGRSHRACCDFNERYVPGSGCVTDPSCVDSCDNPNENNLFVPEDCKSYTHESTAGKYYQFVEGIGNITRDCAPCTLFDQSTCMCSTVDTSQGCAVQEPCRPSANFTLENDFGDSSGNNLYVGVSNAIIQTGSALFSGDGAVNIYRFSADDFGQTLAIRVQFTSYAPAGSGTQALVTNCVFSSDLSATIAIVVERTAVSDTVRFMADTEVTSAYVGVPFNPNGVNDVIFIYDGVNLTGVVNGVKSQTALTGKIKIRKSGIIMGSGSQIPYFTGTLNDFELYKCMPAFAEQYRT